jgi:type I thyroxine 5'-deiodinase
VVYIEEAHASDVWQVPGNRQDQVVYASPRDGAERTALAQACVRNLKIDIPALIDTFDNATERAYTAWPDRLYVVDRYGRIAHKSDPGPFGFRPKPMEEALKRSL